MNPTNTDPVSDEDSTRPVTRPNLKKLEDGWGTSGNTTGGSGNFRFNPSGDKPAKDNGDTGTKNDNNDGFRFNDGNNDDKTGTSGTTGANSSLLSKELAAATGVTGTATTFAGGAKNFFLGSKRRKQATIGGGVAGTLIGGTVFVITLLSGPAQIVQLDQMLSRNFNTTNQASGSRSVKLIRNLRAQDVGETRLSVLGQKRLRSTLSDLGDLGITIKPNSAGYFGANEAGTIDTEKMKAKYPQLEGMSSNERASWLEGKLGIPAGSLEYSEKGVFNVNASDWSLSSVKAFVTNANGLLGNGRLSNAIANRSLTKYFDIPDLFHVYNTPISGATRNATNAADAIKAEQDAQAKERQAIENVPEAEGAVKDAKDNAGTYSSFTANALLYTSGTCFLKSTADDIVTINRYRVVLPAAVTALRFISIGEQIKYGQDITQQDAESAEQSLYNSKGQSVWKGQALQYTDGTPNPTGPDIPAQYGQAFSTSTTASTLKTAAEASLLGSGFLVSIACSTGGQIVQGALSVMQGLGGAIAAVAGQPELTAADLATFAGRVGTFAGEAFLQIKAMALLQNLVLSKTATGTLAKDAFSGPVGGNLLAYGAREAANMGSVLEGGVSLGSSVSNAIAEDQQQQAEQQFQSQSLFARMFDINNSRSLLGHLADSVNPNYARTMASTVGGIGNIGGNLLSNLGTIFTPKSWAASQPYDWGFPLYSIPPQLLTDPNLANPYTNADEVSQVLDAQCLDENGNTKDCDYRTKALTCFGVDISKDSGVWDTTTKASVSGGDVDPNSDDYQGAHCDDLSDGNWQRIIMFVFDTHTMKSMDCYLGSDDECQDIGYGTSDNSSMSNSGSTNSGPTPSGDAQQLAAQILALAKEGKISFSIVNPANANDDSTAEDNIKDTAAGKSAQTSSSCLGGGVLPPNKTATIDPKLLQFIVELAGQEHFTINELVGGCHDEVTSNHYKGTAVDFGCPFDPGPADSVGKKYGVFDGTGETCSNVSHYHYSIGGN